jgi:methionyl-tRNA formyltransferase
VAHSWTGDVQHRYVAKRLADEFPEELAAIIVATGIRRSPAQRALLWSKRYSVSQLASRMLARTYARLIRRDQQRQRTFGSVLFPDGEDGQMPRPDIVRRIPSHNGPECLALLEEIKPDVVAVYGTLIIGRKIIAAAKCMINVHTGLSPTYRGSDTIFWALHNGEPQNVGVTVHRVDPGVDSGPILARGRPRIDPGDSEDRLFAKAVQLGAELLCRAIRREFAGSAKPLIQDLGSGREFRSVQRNVAAELRTRKLLKQGLLSQGQESWSEEY